MRIFALALVALLFVACKKDQEPGELIVGTWTLESTEVLATVQSGDGSSLTFDGCSTTCTGTDYDGSNGTYGNFTYSLNEEGTILVISDTSNNGGGNNATWDVLELTSNSLRMTTSTVLGNVKREYVK